ncbi:unnamed protein product [Ceutorhynchus assimilis]|uniref:Uncharacterized protein n=1 Tax=Ceutorhynchus assimilis TaxID=467358 RepID=A0A9N9MNN2_9CUCU|nr:unnamed protein product [Ceutorhynchus assimilis]
MHAMNTMCEGLEELANVRLETDQHVDASDSRMKRDMQDINELHEWFLSHDPFPEVTKIISVASGVVGNNLINYHNTREVVTAFINKMTGQTFNNIKLKRAYKVLPLLAMSSTIKVHDKTAPMDPILLFQRMSITETFEDELKRKIQIYNPDTTSINALLGQGCPRCGGLVFAVEQQLAKATIWHKKYFNYCTEYHRPLDSTLACDGPDKEVHCCACYAKLFGPKGCFNCADCSRSLDSTNQNNGPNGKIYCRGRYG